MRIRSILSVLIVVGLSTNAFADFRKLNKQGNQAYSKNDIEQALKYYQEAEIEKPQEPILEYNIGTALFGQAKYEDAVRRYAKALHTDDPLLQGDAYYNMGSSFFRNDRYAEAITAYQKSLELNPDDVEAKYNLELARKKLKEQTQQKNQQQQNQDQQQDKQDQQQNQDQQNQDQQNQQNQQDQQKQDEQDKQDQQQGQQGEQKQDQQQQQEEKQGQQEDQQQQQQGGQGDQQQAQKDGGQGEDQKMSKEDAQRILRAIGNDEKDLQKKVNRTKVKFGTYKSKNDW